MRRTKDTSLAQGVVRCTTYGLLPLQKENLSANPFIRETGASCQFGRVATVPSWAAAGGQSLKSAMLRAR